MLVLDDADIPLAARRIVFGKLLNCGQTCVAPDYVLVQPGARERLIETMKQEIRAALGGDPLANPEYPHIVNEKHAQRLHGLLRFLFSCHIVPPQISASLTYSLPCAAIKAFLPSRSSPSSVSKMCAVAATSASLI